MAQFDGFLFAMLDRIGSKNEGPEYFLQQHEAPVLDIRKRVEPWQEDPQLQPFVGQRVEIDGEIEDGHLKYGHIRSDFQPPQLELRLHLEQETVWLDKEPSSSSHVTLPLHLLVRWPYRSIWHGDCETTQIYDFVVEHHGQVMWRWSRGRSFDPQLTKVEVPGGDYHAFSVTWEIDPDLIESAGMYIIRGVFLASAQAAQTKMEIRLAR